MMTSGLLLLLVATGSAQYTTITDAGQENGPAQFVMPNIQSGVTPQPLKQANGNAPIQWVAAATAPTSAPVQTAPSSAPAQNVGSLSSLLGGAAAEQPPAMRSPASGPMGWGGSPASAPPAMHSRSHHSHHDIDLSRESIQVVKGLVEAFLHKVALSPGEKKCLETNIGTFAGDIMGTVGDVVTASKALIAGKGSIAKGQTNGVMAAGMDGGMKLMSLVSLSTSVLRNCVHGDALELMKMTGQHMINGTYLEHRILVNGVDIARSLSDAIISFEAHHFYRFGNDIGIALRKILLSKATGGSRLPEGVPDQVIIQKATEGLMDGFFVRGSSVEVTDSADPNVDIVVDLHQCIAGNSMFFKEVWMSAWDLFAHISINKEQHGLEFKQGKGTPKWQGELMVAMMQIPMAMQKCGVSSQMQQMFMEAIKSLQGLQVDFNFPEHHVSGQEATQRMAKAVQAWTRWDFEKFGYELGMLFRELVMLAFPQKYAIDASGKLWLSSELEKTRITKQASTVFATTIIGGAALMFTAVLMVVRVTRRRSQPESMELEVPLSDVEGGEIE